MATQHDARLARAQITLEGLSVGDAFGDQYFLHPDIVGRMVEQRALRKPPWLFTGRHADGTLYRRDATAA